MNFSNQTILIDTGYFLALHNPLDPEHQKAKNALVACSSLKWFTTWPVITEVCHILWKFRPKSVEKFLKCYESGAFEVFALDKNHICQICTLMTAYHKLPMDLADASLVVLAETFGHGKILTTDRRDFLIYRWGNKKPFENLL